MMNIMEVPKMKNQNKFKNNKIYILLNIYFIILYIN